MFVTDIQVMSTNDGTGAATGPSKTRDGEQQRREADAARQHRDARPPTSSRV